jgi:hypothetical protein
MDPQNASFLSFLDPEMIFETINHQNGAISGPSNLQNGPD